MTLIDTAQAVARIEKAMWVYLARVFRKFDPEEFKLQAVAQSNALSTVSGWGEWIEEMVDTVNRVCVYGPKDPDAYLRELESRDAWGEAEAIFSLSMEKARYNDPRSEPDIVATELVDSLCSHNHRHSVLIADLLPRLVELKQFDLQMHAALRRRWTYIDLILDRWFQEERTVRCGVPRW